ncbi:dihydrofolate reductase family protein [Pelomonas sp. SE-A7]|uniref:dihydrofolate reductase family protein n=1 Tax=Pelomonas sp. SE-A7 TaxID=3054953 RepID=UPI00259CC087|nr:dihydrofolate reductase family protein [Pelomonas sp. SE-A7]MDM4765804.1 dihydrofolate reductase family protein [Pelomonas sp. SE-A7]
MSRVKVSAFAVSIDGYGAGPEQSLLAPLGMGGHQLHEWMFHTRTFQERVVQQGGAAGDQDLDDDFARRSFDNIGAWILGRNMFGPVRGPWPDESWKGWWGDEPPYHVPVFVLTHHERPDLVMVGGTTFHFVTGGIEEALQRAKAGAQGRDVRIGGGVATVRQYLQAGLIDVMHLVMSPALLGRGEALLTGIDLVAQGFKVSEHVRSAHAQHVVLRRD